jgi:hypothetical protein
MLMSIHTFCDRSDDECDSDVATASAVKRSGPSPSGPEVQTRMKVMDLITVIILIWEKCVMPN